MLIYSLNLGEVSIKKCYSSYENMLKHSNESRKLIPEWHQSVIRRIGIELSKNRYKKQGFESIVAKPLSLLDK